ncbi:MAG: T9SS type A sorting domain-containing protein, partial [Ignavibacteria bacterium]|nr:T9SS type A sorting domain-containing protein [Ignavibacteria bacterium]
FNEIFNNFLWNNLMFYKDTLNLPIRVGKAMYNVKNQLPSIGENDMKFCLIGDPSQRISIPQYFTRVDSINSTPGNDTAEIKALQKMRLYGSVLKPDSTLWNDFSGDIVIKVLDVDKYITYIDFNRPFNFRLDGGIIFKGSTKVTNGKWALEFIVPKDISYSPGRGKILAYFSNPVYEGSGYSENFRLNGIDSAAAVDTTGPEISLFMDSRNFRSGDLINQNSKIIADFFDENGINLTGAIGHKIEAIINSNENDKIDLTSYYNATSGYKYGTIEFPYENIPDGQYTLKLRAWDTYNNLSEQEIAFNVKNNSALSVFNVFNYPNPMKDNTNFTFQHNLNASLSAEIKIFSVAGRVIKTIKRTNITDKFVSIDWDGKDSDGDFIANGTYIYKLIIKSEDGAFSNIQTGKLAKLK